MDRQLCRRQIVAYVIRSLFFSTGGCGTCPIKLAELPPFSSPHFRFQSPLPCPPPKDQFPIVETIRTYRVVLDETLEANTS
jgi:hypothetical protein